MMEQVDMGFDWQSQEGKQATARLNSLLEHIDKDAAREGLVRKVIRDGETVVCVTWGKP
jgi:hypothetical protein